MCSAKYVLSDEKVGPLAAGREAGSAVANSQHISKTNSDWADLTGEAPREAYDLGRRY